MAQNQTYPSDGSIPNLPEHATLYGYIPNEEVCITFIVLFALSTFIHIGQAAKANYSIVSGGSTQPSLLDPYLMQICTTILAPSWMTAANFTILGIIIRLLGTHYSWLSPRMYLIIFLFFDLVALVGQAVGGAQASLAVQAGNDPTPGGNIMCYFIIVQMGAICLYTLCAAEFLARYHFNKPVRRARAIVTEKDGENNGQEVQVTEATRRRKMDARIKLMLLGLVLSTLFIFIRSIYRTIELLDGWTGRIITTEVYFNVLDGAAIVLSMYSINFLHPGFLLRDDAVTLGRKPKPEEI
ncbi:hypothetical protein CPB86DRAFT_818806 [Serendipita vermifera]|nr:hypothetical protein CPB86DRAFT_818806 [Serendipita vermifera]